MVTGVIQGFDSETISKPGKKPFTVHKLCVDGVWYECGYRKPAFGIGELVSFDAEKKYGKMAVTTDIARGAGVGGSAPAATEAPKSSGGGRGYGGVAKEFPVPALHPDRSIIRQNALAHATKLYGIVIGSMSGIAVSDIDAAAEQIITLAYKFEEYATGQREVNALEDESM